MRGPRTALAIRVYTIADRYAPCYPAGVYGARAYREIRVYARESEVGAVLMRVGMLRTRRGSKAPA